VEVESGNVELFRHLPYLREWHGIVIADSQLVGLMMPVAKVWPA
jgi:hypothetical protein